MTPYFHCKSSHRIKEQPLIRAGFAIPEGALLSGFHCIKITLYYSVYLCTSGEKVHILDEAERVQSVSYPHIRSLSGLYIMQLSLRQLKKLEKQGLGLIV